MEAQEQYFIRHPAFNNLPSFECYNVMQCEKGYIWVGTAKGLFWYNADSVFAAKNPRGKLYESCYDVKQLNANALLVLGNDNYLYGYNYLSKSCDSITFTNSLQNEIKNEYLTAYNLSNINRQWLFNTQYQTFKLNPETREVKLLQDTDSLNDFCFVIEGNQCYQIKKYFSKKRQGQLINGDTLRVTVIKNGKPYTFKLKIGSNNFPNWRTFCALTKEGELVFSLNSSVFKLSEQGKLSRYVLPDDILNIYIDKDNDLWVGVLKGGVHYFENADLNKHPVSSLKGISVTGICFDRESNVWCTSLDKGVFFCRNKHYYYYPSIPDLNNSLFLQRQIGNVLYLCGGAGKVIRIENKVAKEFTLKGISTFVRDIIDCKGGFYFIADKVYKTDSLFTKLTPIESKNKTIGLPANLFYLNKDSIIGISKERLFYINKTEYSAIDSTPELMNYYLMNNNVKVFMSASKQNFYEINRKLQFVPQLKFPIRVARSAVAPDSSIWFFSADDSLYRLKKNLLTNITKKYNLNIPDLADIKVDDKGMIWLCGTGILSRIKFNDNGFIITKYNVHDGIRSMNIRRIHTYKNEVYLNTDEGLFVINDSAVNSPPPILYLNRIISNRKVITNDGKHLELDYNENSLQIYFDILNFSTPGKPSSLLYRILETDTAWRKVNAPIIELFNLNPGHHTIQVIAINNKGVRSKIVFEFTVDVAPPFWKQVWFIILMTLFGMCLILYLVKKVEERVTKREREKAEVAATLTKYQMNALQAQMNPHFLFNAISGIQRYILKKDKQEAYDYLAKFSKLIRLVLYNSQKSEVSLASELEIIGLYVEMEQLRFDSKFNFQLNNDSTVNIEDVFIPPMLIQPYVENAIWHGLMNLNNNKIGALAVNVMSENKHITITVEDNGVGREKARQFKNDPGHQSIGMSITEKRLKVLGELIKNGVAEVEIIDLKDGFGNAAGTKVIVKISTHDE